MSELHAVDLPTLSRYRQEGKTLELGRILIILNGLSFRWDGDKQTILMDKRELIKLIEGE